MDFCPHGKIEEIVAIELKQNKEDMEEKKQKLDKLVDDYMACRIQYAEFDKEIKALYDKEESEPTLKQFDLEDAKSGKTVCTRDGRKARIICFDRKDDIPIIALIESANGGEILQCYFNDGKCCHNETSDYDLMMLPEKKEMWINIYGGTTRLVPGGYLYDTVKKAKDAAEGAVNYVTTTKVCWEE